MQKQQPPRAPVAVTMQAHGLQNWRRLSVKDGCEASVLVPSVLLNRLRRCCCSGGTATWPGSLPPTVQTIDCCTSLCVLGTAGAALLRLAPRRRGSERHCSSKNWHRNLAIGCRRLAKAASLEMHQQLTQEGDSEPDATNDDERWLLRYLPDIPGPSNTSDEMAESFLEAVNARGIALYAKQEEAILEVFGDSHVVLSTPTGSGKSLVAMSMLFKAVAEGRRAYYTCPIKALVSEKFFDLCRAFGPDLVGMATGDVSINSRASIVCCTAEVLANVALRDGSAADVDYAVMDEFHYFGDASRGFAWEAPLLRLPRATFLLMSATMGSNPRLHETLERLTGRSVRVVSSQDRPVPLDWSYWPSTVLESLSKLVKEDKVPVYVVNFTQHDAAQLASLLVMTGGDLSCSQERKEEIRKTIGDVRFNSPYGPQIRSYLLNGIGLHHAGLLPRYRLLVERLAQSGLLWCICGTDTLGVGVNVPIRTVLFTRLCKFNGETTVILRSRDFHQIAGRAGRRGFDDQGSVVAVAPEHEVENMKLEAKIQSTTKSKDKAKLSNRRRAAPDRNYKHWDEATFKRLKVSPPEPLLSQFQLSQGTVLSVLQGAQAHGRDGGQELDTLVAEAQCSEAQKYFWQQQIGLYSEALVKSGLVSREGDTMKLNTTLQQDFLLFQDVSLFLVEVLPLLQWEYSSGDEFATAVLSIVEAVCEDPVAVLNAQTNYARSQRMEALKRKKVSFEKRVAEVELVEREKPLPAGTSLLPAFKKFIEQHPWVSKDELRPKAVVQEMFRDQLTFNDFIDRLSSADKYKKVVRQEGLLLRYLTQVHKTMRHNIPEEYKNDELLEVEAFLLATVNATDTSLLREWEQLKALEQGTSLRREDNIGSMEQDERVLLNQTALEVVPDDIAEVGTGTGTMGGMPETELEARALQLRVRVEMLRLARHLAQRRWKDAALDIRLSYDDTGRVWDADLLAEAVRGCGMECSCNRDAIEVEMGETEAGWEVEAVVYAKDDPDTVAMQIEAFGPWPKTSFEQLLELRRIG